MNTTDPNNILILKDIIKVIDETAHNLLVVSRDTSQKVSVESLNNSRNSLIDHALLIVFALKIYIHVAVMNIHVLIYPYKTCHVFDVVVDRVCLQTVKIPHH